MAPKYYPKVTLSDVQQHSVQNQSFPAGSWRTRVAVIELAGPAEGGQDQGASWPRVAAGVESPDPIKSPS